MNAPNRVRQVYAKELENEQHDRVDVIAGDANAATYRYYERQICQDLYKFLDCRHVERDAARN